MSDANIIVSQDGLVSVIEKQGFETLLKPLTQEIHLFDSYIAGTTHLSDRDVLEKIAIGDKLTLQREENKFDSNAILILNHEKKKLGYIPERDNIIFARLMDAGKLLIAKIQGFTMRGSFKQISIGIYLVDF